MKKLNTLSCKEVLHYIMESKRLREKFDNYIQQTEMDWLDDKLSVFNFGCANWSIGFYNPNFLHVRDASEFLRSVEESASSFGCSDKLQKLIARCNKLYDSNLFEHYVGKLCELYYEEELRPIVKHVEDCGYDIYRMDETERLEDYVEAFAECYLDDVYINSSNRLVRLDYLSA